MRKLLTVLFFLIASMGVVLAKSNSLVNVRALPLPENKVRLDFEFSEPIKQLPASFITEKPARIVLDFVYSDLKIPEDQKSKSIKLGSLDKYTMVSVGDRVRCILDLDRSVSYSGNIAGNVYSLVINGKGRDLYGDNKEIFITHQPVNAKHDILHVDFKGIDKQGGRLLIKVSDSSIPIDVTQQGNKVEVNFLNTKMSKQVARRYDVADFHTPAEYVTFAQEGKNVHMTIVNKGGYGHFVYQVDKQFMVDVFPLTAEEIRQAKLKKQVFSGKRISLNFQNINIRAVLQLLADFTGVNMVVSDRVQGDITLRLNDIPWDQALDIILTTKGLDKRRAGNVLLIDEKKALDNREADELKSQQALQKLEPVRSDLIQINYAKAADLAILIKDKQSSLLSERGKISVDVRTNTIWIQDTGSKINEIRDLVKQLDVPVRQVLIEARIVDVTKTFTQEIGIVWGISRPNALSGTLRGANQMQQGTAPADVLPITDRLNLDLPAVPASAQAASVGIALAKLGQGILLDLELSALESEGLAEVIASPKVITTNQQPALIQSGQEIPYQEATSSGATAVAFKKAVLSLKVIPQITPDNKILMDLQINQDTASNQLFNGVPSILTKSIQTNVLVNNGQTIVLGGIYSQNKDNEVERVPFLGKLPVVGSLFRHKTMTLDNEELLIFITPRIITNSLSVTTIEGEGGARGRFDEK